MKLIISLLLCLYSLGAASQSDTLIKNFDTKRYQLNKKGMIVLSTWGGATMIGSAIGYGLTNSHEEKQFYLMNGAWGLINLGIALPGALAKQKNSASIYEMQKTQTKMEKIFLANAMLDITYVTGGVLLKQYSYNQTDIKKQQQFNGFGNAVIIQGAGLLIFDSFMTILNNRNRKKNLDPILKKASISFTGNYFRVGYRF
jgi:MFS family permease